VAWWKETRGLLAKYHAGGRHRVVMIDANGRLGSVCSDAVGSMEPQPHDTNGKELHAWALAEDYFIPSAFLGGGATWRTHRLDYVAIPAAWNHEVTQTRVLDEVPLTLYGQEDHRAAMVGSRTYCDRTKDFFRGRDRCAPGRQRSLQIELR